MKRYFDYSVFLTSSRLDIVGNASLLTGKGFCNFIFTGAKTDSLLSIPLSIEPVLLSGNGIVTVSATFDALQFGFLGIVLFETDLLSVTLDNRGLLLRVDRGDIFFLIPLNPVKIIKFGEIT